MELSLYYDLLPPGGIIIGDDYMMFPAVKHDVDLFCKVQGIQLLFTGERDTWPIQKPVAIDNVLPLSVADEVA